FFFASRSRHTIWPRDWSSAVCSSDLDRPTHRQAEITGEYFGWNFGLPVGGPVGVLIASLIVCVLYLAWVLGLSELSVAMPFAGEIGRASGRERGAGSCGVRGVDEYED